MGQKAPPFGRGPKVRPPARAFSAAEARDQRLSVEQKRDRFDGNMYYVLNGSQNFLDGYLVKTVALKGLALEPALPPLDELQRYSAVRPIGRPLVGNVESGWACGGGTEGE